MIDFQRDFCAAGGYSDRFAGLDWVKPIIAPARRLLLAAARASGMLVIHTREGHLADLSDCPPAKLQRGKPSQRIGDQGALGRILIRGEYGHDIIDELAPIDGEVVIDKPGKGAFYATELQEVLENAGITHLIVTGVTTEVCVHTTVREANDRGYDCLVLSDCVGSYFPEFQRVGLEMVSAQGGIFGWVADSNALLAAMTQPALTCRTAAPEFVQVPVSDVNPPVADCLCMIAVVLAPSSVHPDAAVIVPPAAPPDEPVNQ